MNKITMRVLGAVCEFAGVEASLALARDRHQSVVLARMIAIYVLREHQIPRPSFPELGREFGNRDHTSAMSACRRIAKKLAAGDRFVAEAVEAGRSALERSPQDTLLAKFNRRAELKRELAELEDEIRALTGADFPAIAKAGVSVVG